MSNPQQSFAFWSFAGRGRSHEELLAGAAAAGCTGVDFLDESLWPLARRHGLAPVCMVGHGTLQDGLNRRENADRIETELRRNIAKAASHGIPVLVCFSGDRRGLPDPEGMDRCVETLARVAPAAASAGVVLALELLNSRIDHPDYQADRTRWGVEVCEQIGSPAVKLLYDIYHMWIMEGEVIASIERHHRHFAHYHTAGHPGRGPIGEYQEIDYVKVFRAVAATGYAGYVSHEFTPSGDPLADLAAACEITRRGFTAG